MLTVKKRTPLRITLRALLTITAIAAGLFALEVRKWRNRKAVAEAVRQGNGIAHDQIDPAIEAMRSAVAFANTSACVSVLLAVSAVVVWLVARGDLRSSAFTIAPQCVHPAWYFSRRMIWYDNGEAMVIASKLWIAFGCIALFLAVFSAIRGRKRPRSRLSLHLTTRHTLILTLLVAVVLVLTRPPISDLVFPHQSISMLTMGVILYIGYSHSGQIRQRRFASRSRLPETIWLAESGAQPVDAE